MLDFYCCVTNDHKFSSLKQHTLSHCFHGLDIWAYAAESFVSVSYGYNKGVSEAVLASEGLTGEQSTFKLIPVVGKIQFLELYD